MTLQRVSESLAHLGVTVTIDRSEVDGVPVVFVDTEVDGPENDDGPLVRVRLNDHLLHGPEVPAL